MEAEVEKMTLKEFRQFERKFVIARENKINQHFRTIFAAQCSGELKEYVNSCRFEESINYSIILYVNDAIGKYSIQYKNISFFTFNDPANQWKLEGEPLQYRVYTPGNYQLYLNEDNIFLLRMMIPLALFLWNRYRYYINTKPCDDGYIDSSFSPTLVDADSYSFKLSMSVSTYLHDHPHTHLVSVNDNDNNDSNVNNDTFYERLKKRLFYNNANSVS